MSRIQTGTIVAIAKTSVWCENGIAGERFVVVQHEGCDPFDYAVFNYDYRYTNNSSTIRDATNLAKALGATEPVEFRPRREEFCPLDADGLRAIIDQCNELLKKKEQSK